MTRVQTKWNGDNWLKAVKTAAEDALYAGAAVAADSAARSMGRSHGGISSSPGSPPNVQTSHLRNSIAFVHARDLGRPLTAAFGTNVPYGRFLEFGATVRARDKKLTVPLNQKAKRLLASVGGNIRALALRVVPTKSGAFLALPPSVKGGDPEFLFKLEEEVVIAPRPWLLPTVKRDKARILGAMRTRFRERLHQLYRGLK